MSLVSAVRRFAQQDPDRLAVFDVDRQISWGELEERTTRLAHVLVDDLELAAGDTVAVLTPNRVEVVELLLACAKAQVVYVGLNYRMTLEELDLALDNAQPKVVFAGRDHTEQAAHVVERYAVPAVQFDEPDGYEALVAAADADPLPLPAASADALACIVYTSGTTGAPKGVAFTHRVVLQHATIAALEYEIGPTSRYLVQIPHNSSVNITIVPCLLAGAALGFADNRGFDADRFAQTVCDYAITHTFLVPTQLMRLLDQLPADDERLRSLTTLGYGSSPIAPDRLGELVARLGPIFIQLYGMAEIASIGTLLRKQDHVAALDDRPELLRSAGTPSLGIDVVIRDDEGRDVPVGERGEVVFTGHHLMAGYHRDPERTDAALIGGWMHSGDIGVLDERGYLSIVDRKKDIIIRGGQNLSPTEVENVLYQHDDVLEAAVVGAPDPEWGERVVAVVSLKEGRQVSSEALLEFVARSSLPRYCRPEEIRVEPTLPKNAVGKIDKKAVRSAFWSAERAV